MGIPIFLMFSPSETILTCTRNLCACSHCTVLIWVRLIRIKNPSSVNAFNGRIRINLIRIKVSSSVNAPYVWSKNKKNNKHFLLKIFNQQFKGNLYITWVCFRYVDLNALLNYMHLNRLYELDCAHVCLFERFIRMSYSF